MASLVKDCFKMFRKQEKKKPTMEKEEDIEGALYIMILIFSGMPNPQWPLKPDNPHYTTINEQYLAAKQNKLTKPLSEIKGGLGFNGFWIRESGQHRNSAQILYNSQTKELQKCMLETAPECEVDDDFKERLLGYIEEQE